MRPFSSVLAVGVLATATAIAVIGGPAASAHTELISASPADGSVLDQPPTEVVFTFDEDLLPGANAISIFDDAGAVLAKGQVEPQGAVVRLPVPAGMAPGLMHAAYRVVSADGHPVTGEVTFTVLAGAATPAVTPANGADSGPTSASSAGSSAGATPEPTVDPTRTREEGRASANFSIVLGVVLVALAVALYVKRRRQANR